MTETAMRLPSAPAAVLALALALAATAARAESALVAVATNFRPVAEVLAADFKAASGHEITLTAGATAKLAAQIGAGAPFDAFLAADTATPARLAEAGLAEAATVFTYATGRLVLWSADPALDLSDPAAALAAARHVAIANPDLAPYGRAAMQAIDFMGLSDLSDRLVTGENIGQAQVLVATGAADLGFVAASGLVDPGGAAWPVPEGHHDPIRQDAVLLAHGRDNAAAAAFLAYLRSDAARRVIERFGYAAGA
jgi:molybdate transport system substrate-binding protein